MRVFPVGIEHAPNVAVQCAHDADPRVHQEVATFGGTDQAWIAVCHSGTFCSAFGSFIL
jgi:hypothetical protein